MFILNILQVLVLSLMCTIGSQEASAVGNPHETLWGGSSAMEILARTHSYGHLMYMIPIFRLFALIAPKPLTAQITF